MGKKISIVSFLCGVLSGRKKAAVTPPDEAEKREEGESSTTTSGGESPEQVGGEEEEQQPLPLPPGGVGRHTRTVSSCEHRRTHSGVSKLVSSMSLKIIGGEEKVKQKLEKKFHKHEDNSVWKKTIILGEKCRVPDEDEDEILYDEKGRKISTYHPKTHSGVLSKQTSSFDEADHDFDKK